MNLKKLTLVLAALVVTFGVAEARGRCDGIHGCRCGSTQASHFGLPRMFNGYNLWQAVDWVRAFPHTMRHEGAVMYQHGGGPTGHVSRIEHITGPCTAVVADDKGQYERNTCIRGATFVDPNGNRMARNETQTFHSKRHHRSRHVQVAQVYSAPDRLMVH